MSPDVIWSRVSPCPETGCWLWIGRYGPRGYGQMRPGRGEREYRAHRLSWEIYRGPIPVGLHVLHKCDVPECVNPEHLFLGTDQDNADDCASKRRHRRCGLSMAQVDEIRRRRESGETLMSLAAAYGVAHTTIRGILVGKTRWALEDTP